MFHNEKEIDNFKFNYFLSVRNFLNVQPLSNLYPYKGEPEETNTEHKFARKSLRRCFIIQNCCSRLRIMHQRPYCSETVLEHNISNEAPDTPKKTPTKSHADTSRLGEKWNLIDHFYDDHAIKRMSI